jgi:hypothetical protein
MAKANKKFITVAWKSGREPVDDLFWCEAEYDGAWTSINSLEKLRTRREVIEKVSELDHAIIGFDFAFSFPKPFIEFLRAQSVSTDWHSLAKKIREDLKKNTDDGVRIWIEHIGRYREASLEPLEDAMRPRWEAPDRNGRKSFQREALAPYERRSLAERFRRIDMILKRKDAEGIESTLGIRFNKLTERYEFTDSQSRGRAALLGISMLEQLIELKPEIAIWPFMKPAEITAVEIYPKMFSHIAPAKNPEKLKKFFDVEEDNALYVAKEVRELVYANPKAHEIVFTLIGMIKAERREDKTLRPLRDYREYFYISEGIQAEGWAYGIGFKEPEKPAKEVEVSRTDFSPSEKNDGPKPAPLKAKETAIEQAVESIAEAAPEILVEEPSLS